MQNIMAYKQVSPTLTMPSISHWLDQQVATTLKSRHWLNKADTLDCSNKARMFAERHGVTLFTLFGGRQSTNGLLVEVSAHGREKKKLYFPDLRMFSYVHTFSICIYPSSPTENKM